MKRKKDNKNTVTPKNKADKTFMLYIHDVVYLLCIVLVLFLLVFRIVVVSGPSMKNTLVDGDYVLLLNNVFTGEHEHGDIVVISKRDYSDEPIIKRVIATAGDTVDIAEGVVYRNGEALDEPYTRTPTYINYDNKGIQLPLTVPEGYLFVMGDNRNHSLDSRSTDIGLVDVREVLGEAIFLALPGTDGGNVPMDFDRFGGI